MNKIDNLKLVFENIESYEIPGKAVKRFNIKSMKINTQLNDHHSVSLKFPDSTICDELILDLRTRDINNIPTTQSEEEGNIMMLPHRLTTYHDIVWIECTMDTGTSFSVQLPYNADINDDNLWMQSNIITDHDGVEVVHIVVKKEN